MIIRRFWRWVKRGLAELKAIFFNKQTFWLVIILFLSLLIGTGSRICYYYPINKKDGQSVQNTDLQPSTNSDAEVTRGRNSAKSDIPLATQCDEEIPHRSDSKIQLFLNDLYNSFLWAVSHFFDLGEVRKTLAGEESAWFKFLGAALYAIGWIIGCGVLISIIIDEKMEWRRRCNIGLNHSRRNLKNHVVILGWDEMACSLIRELLKEAAAGERKIGKIIILSSHRADDIVAQLHRYQIEVNMVPVLIDPWYGEYDSEDDIKKLRIESAHAVYVLGEHNESGHDLRVLALLDFLKDYLAGKWKKEYPLPCYALIDQYQLYWGLIREFTGEDDEKILQVTAINFYENWCKHLWSSLPERERWNYPHLCIDWKSEKDVALVIAGFSAMGQTMLIEALRVAHFVDLDCGEAPIRRKTKIFIIDPDADALWNEFLAAHPESETIPGFEFPKRINEIVSSEKALSFLKDLDDRDHHQLTVALTYRDTDRALSDAILLKQNMKNPFTLLVREDSSVIHSMSDKSENLKLYGWDNIFFFGRRCDSAYNPWHRENMAKNLHENYLDGLEERRKKSQEEWKYLAPRYRWKYFYQIDSLPEILHSFGIEIVPVESKSDRKAADSSFWKDEEIPRLAECSHNRWWADRILEGWHLGDVYDKESKTAPNMKPYRELDEENKKIDIQFIKKMPIFLHKSGYGLKRI